MKETLSIEEIDLILKWQEEPKEDIALYFFNKYKDDILSINYSKIKMKFSSIPLEKEDFFYLVWKSCLVLLKEYDVKKGGSFRNLLIKKTYEASIKEALKFIRNTHIVLNNSYSYERLLENNKNFKICRDGKVEIDDDFYTKTKNFIDFIVSFNKEFREKDVKRVLYLKSLGYSNEDIAKKLRRPVRWVSSIVDYVCKITKKLFN